MLEYHAAYYDAGAGWCMAKILDFPGIVTQGRTLNSARRMPRDALREMALWHLEQGDPRPRPNPRARDRHARQLEPIRLPVRIETGTTAP
jgi:predicted RNase H-like HicB family nuclease